MRFFSDNAAAAHPKVIEAIMASNRLDTAYDGDEWSAKLDGAFSELFETQVRALWVTTGTAANCLALAALCPPYGGILCHNTRRSQLVPAAVRRAIESVTYDRIASMRGLKPDLVHAAGEQLDHHERVPLLPR